MSAARQGGFSYTEDLSGLLAKVLSLLETGGVFYSLVPGVHLEDGKDKLPGTWYLAGLEHSIGRPEKVCSWLKKTACVQVTCESKSDWDRPTELINIRKVCSAVSVTPINYWSTTLGFRPGGDFNWNSRVINFALRSANRKDQRRARLDGKEINDGFPKLAKATIDSCRLTLWQHAYRAS